MEFKEAKIISLWQDGVKVAETIVEEKTTPVVMNSAKSPDFICPSCGASAKIVEGGSLHGGNFRYCPNCGKRVLTDWG